MTTLGGNGTGNAMVAGGAPPRPRTAGVGVDREESRALLLRLSGLAADDPERRAVRDRLVTLHLPLVEHLA
ncbi:MAG TPA: hypothetical protein VK894_09985, partial [Jiangellales bacterium]|nr:hypothetical protein [Jiangellales bacterium]